MRKKIFAVALAAAMTVTSAMSAFAETKAEVTMPAAWGENTGDEKLVGDFDVTYTFHVASTLTTNFDTFAVEFYSDAVETGTTGKGYLSLRPDVFGWWAEGWTAEAVEGQTDVNANWSPAGTEIDWDAWKTDVADADVTVNLKRTGEVIDVNLQIKGVANTYNITNSIENKGGFGDYVYVHITSCQETANTPVKLTNVKFTNNTAGGAAGGNDTPAAGGNDTPAAGGNDTPAAGGNDTPAAGGNDTPAAGGNNAGAGTGTNAPAGNGNAGGATTGDVAPYAVAVLAVAAAAVVVVLQKKKVTE